MVPLALLLAALCGLPRGAPLRLVEASIPVYKQVGESTTLICDFDLEGHGLYSVKWYKDDVEFYRYMPRRLPPKVVYSLPGIHVDVDGSDEISVRLTMLDMASTGNYRCEVSGEAPEFKTVNKAGTMVVVVLPEGDPIITGQEEVYEPDSYVNLNCTSERSKPAAQLMWLVNEQRVGNEFLVPYGIVLHPDGLETSILGLKIPITSRSFRSGEMRLTCVSYIKAFNYASATTDVIASYEMNREVVQKRQASFLVRGAAGSPLPSGAAVLAVLLTAYVVGS